jgi:hypothetical protein
LLRAAQDINSLPTEEAAALKVYYRFMLSKEFPFYSMKEDDNTMRRLLAKFANSQNQAGGNII